jgi:hypothetical protein
MSAAVAMALQRNFPAAQRSGRYRCSSSSAWAVRGWLLSMSVPRTGQAAKYTQTPMSLSNDAELFALDRDNFLRGSNLITR